MQHWISLAVHGQDVMVHLPLQLHASVIRFIPAEIYSLHACVNAIIDKFVGLTLRQSSKARLFKSNEETSQGDKSFFESDYFHYVGHGAECNSLSWFVSMVLWNGARTIATFF